MGDRRGGEDAHALVLVNLASSCVPSSTVDPTRAAISGTDDYLLCSTKPVCAAGDQLGGRGLAIPMGSGLALCLSSVSLAGAETHWRLEWSPGMVVPVTGARAFSEVNWS